jgi:hypothetical protein
MEPWELGQITFEPLEDNLGASVSSKSSNIQCVGKFLFFSHKILKILTFIF